MASCPYMTCPTRSTSATLISLMFTEHTWHTATSGPLHMLVLLLGELFLQTPTLALTFNKCNILSEASLTIPFKIISYLPIPDPPYPAFPLLELTYVILLCSFPLFLPLDCVPRTVPGTGQTLIRSLLNDRMSE